MCGAAYDASVCCADRAADCCETTAWLVAAVVVACALLCVAVGACVACACAYAGRSRRPSPPPLF